MGYADRLAAAWNADNEAHAAESAGVDVSTRGDFPDMLALVTIPQTRRGAGRSIKGRAPVSR
jgi:hypothetical protein